MFAVGAATVYAVEEDFPRVTVKTVPAGITGLTYEIETAAMKPFITSSDTEVMAVSPEE